MSLIPAPERFRKQGKWLSTFYHPPKPGETVLLWSSKWGHQFQDIFDANGIELPKKYMVRVGYYSLKSHSWIIDAFGPGSVVNENDAPEWWHPIGDLPT